MSFLTFSQSPCLCHTIHPTALICLQADTQYCQHFKAQSMSHHITSTIDPLQRVQSRMRRPELLHKQERGKTSPVLRPITLASDQVLHCLQTLRCSLTWCELATVLRTCRTWWHPCRPVASFKTTRGHRGLTPPQEMLPNLRSRS